MDQLQKARQVISQVDNQMAELFVKRMEAVKEVAAYKKEHGMPILDAQRENEIIQKGANRVEDSELRGLYTDFLQDTMAISRRYQRRLNEGMKVAYSGVEGAFAYIAADTLFPQGEKVPFDGFKDAYDAVQNGDCDAAVLPLENSYAGEVGQVTDLLFSGPLYINGTLALAVTHDLLAVPGASLQDIKTVVSHPQALSQCDKFIKTHSFQEMAYENTALAAQYVAE
jgi:chorismate mutase/prephenate dehydratase